MKPTLAILILFAAVSSLLAKDESASLPPAASDRIYTFQQIEKQKAQLKNKIRIEIASLVAGSGDDLGDGTQRYIVEDTSKGVAPFGQMAFPAKPWRNWVAKAPSPSTLVFTFFPRKQQPRFASQLERTSR